MWYSRETKQKTSNVMALVGFMLTCMCVVSQGRCSRKEQRVIMKTGVGTVTTQLFQLRGGTSKTADLSGSRNEKRSFCCFSQCKTQKSFLWIWRDLSPCVALKFKSWKPQLVSIDVFQESVCSKQNVFPMTERVVHETPSRLEGVSFHLILRKQRSINSIWSLDFLFLQTFKNGKGQETELDETICP